MSQYAIVAIGYNRVGSMQRLLKSLSKANYGNDQVTLIISIDNSGTGSVEQCAKEFQWKFGEKRVVTYPERQGLRKHILRCGEFVKDYDAIAVFEDDIIPSPGFYSYMKAAVAFYGDNMQIAGISLYNHLWNVNASIPFEPSIGPYDTYFLQFAQSWGQVWMKKQWFAFAHWYENNCNEIEEQDNIPKLVTSWPKSSWLKYHIKYCVDTDKFFVYPYQALATCFSDVGEHCKEKDTHFQVAMQMGNKENYVFPSLTAGVKYDVFFERIFDQTFSVNAISASDICVNLYGTKEQYGQKRYLLSKRNLPYRIVASFGQEIKPHEDNIVAGIEGDDIFLYDLKEQQNHPPVGKQENLRDFRYHFRLYGSTKMLMYCVLDKIKSKLEQKFAR